MDTVLSLSLMVRVRRGWVSSKRGTSVTVTVNLRCQLKQGDFEMSEYLPRGPDMANGMVLCRIWKAEIGSCLFLNDG